MATATPTRPLDDVLRERWATGPKHSGSVFEDGRLDALDSLTLAIIGDYWVYDDPDGEGETSVPLAPKWIRGLEATIREAGIAAFEAHVVPAVIDVIKSQLPSAPEHLRVYPGSETLRADLAALEGEDR